MPVRISLSPTIWILNGRNSVRILPRMDISYGVQPDINHYEAAKCLTIAGTDIYHPTQDFLTGAEIAFGGDEIRRP